MTTKENDCRPSDAGELLRLIDELVDFLTDRHRTQLIFNFLASHSIMHVPIRQTHQLDFRYPTLRGIKLFLPYSCKRVLGRARVIIPGNNSVALEFKIGNQTSSPLHINGPMPDPGSWSEEIVLTPTGDLGRGWHDLDVIPTASTDGANLTGFTLYAE